MLTEKVAVEPRRDGGHEGARMGVLGVVVVCASDAGNTLTCAWRTLGGRRWCVKGIVSLTLVNCQEEIIRTLLFVNVFSLTLGWRWFGHQGEGRWSWCT